MKKTAKINVVVSNETKDKFKRKADEMGLTITGFIEKISNEEIIFADANLKKAFKMIKINM